jgi:hypothetical protein
MPNGVNGSSSFLQPALNQVLQSEKDVFKTSKYYQWANDDQKKAIDNAPDLESFDAAVNDLIDKYNQTHPEENEGIIGNPNGPSGY